MISKEQQFLTEMMFNIRKTYSEEVKQRELNTNKMASVFSTAILMNPRDVDKDQLSKILMDIVTVAQDCSRSKRQNINVAVKNNHP